MVIRVMKKDKDKTEFYTIGDTFAVGVVQNHRASPAPQVVVARRHSTVYPVEEHFSGSSP